MKNPPTGASHFLFQGGLHCLHDGNIRKAMQLLCNLRTEQPRLVDVTRFPSLTQLTGNRQQKVIEYLIVIWNSIEFEFPFERGTVLISLRFTCKLKGITAQMKTIELLVDTKDSFFE